MPRKRYTPEQIISKHREAKELLSPEKTVGRTYSCLASVSRPPITQVRSLNELERERARLKKLVADLSLDNAILKETLSGN
jgi:hypothetical protein